MELTIKTIDEINVIGVFDDDNHILDDIIIEVKNPHTKKYEQIGVYSIEKYWKENNLDNVTDIGDRFENETIKFYFKGDVINQESGLDITNLFNYYCAGELDIHNLECRAEELIEDYDCETGFVSDFEKTKRNLNNFR